MWDISNTRKLRPRRKIRLARGRTWFGIPILLLTFGLGCPSDGISQQQLENRPPGMWPNGEFRWFYHRGDEPSWITPEEASRLFRDAAARWEACGVKMQFLGETTVAPGKMDGINVVGWSMGIQPSLRGLTIGRGKDGKILERDVSIRPDRQEFRLSRRLLEKVITHELGHAIGLTHSSRCDDVMTLAADCPKADPEKLPVEPTTNDLQRCRAIYDR